MPRGTSLYDEARIQRRLWTPQLLLPSTLFYARAEDAYGAGSSFILPDLSGNGYNATPYQGASNRAPTYDPIKRGLVFNGSPILTAPVPFASTANGLLSIAVICTPNPTQSAYTILVAFRGSSGGVTINYNSDGNKYSYVYGNTFNFGGPPFDGGLDVASISFDMYSGQLSERLLINGTVYQDNASLSGATGSPPATSMMIGSDPNQVTDRIFKGLIHEVLVTKTPLSVYQLRMFGGYGFHKYGSPSRLNVNDPFKNRPPLIGD